MCIYMYILHIYIYIYIYTYNIYNIYIYKTTYLDGKYFSAHVFINSFYLHLSQIRDIKYFLQFLQLVSNKKLKSCGKKILSVNDNKIIQGKLSDNSISTKSRKTKPDTIVMYVCGNCKNPKRVKKTKQKW